MGAESKRDRVIHEALRLYLAEAPALKSYFETQGTQLKTSPETPLDLLFVDEQDPERPKTLPVFGISECLGVYFIAGNETFSEMEAREQSLSEELAQRGLYGHVAYIRVDDVDRWRAYYAQAETLASQVGHRFDELSGLTRVSIRYYREQLIPGLKRNLGLSQSYWQDDKGVTYYQLEENSKLRQNADIAQVLRLPRDYAVDFAFVNEQGGFVYTEMSYVRQPFFEDDGLVLEGEALPEYVISEPKIVGGMVVIRPGENKRDAYLRSIEAKQKILETWPELDPEDVVVPLVSNGQLGLWQKLGITGPIPSYIESISGERVEGLEVDDLIRFLHLGETNINSGKLAKLGLSLPKVVNQFMEGQPIPVDIVFSKGENGNSKLVSIPRPLWSINLSKMEDDETPADFLGYQEMLLKKGKKHLPTIPLTNVSGFVIMPDTVTKGEMKAWLKNFEPFLNAHSDAYRSRILIVTPKLFEKWLYHDTCFATDEEVTQIFHASPLQSHEYGHGHGGGEGYEAYYWRATPGNMVGGFHDGIMVRNQGLASYTFLDTGANFSPDNPHHGTMMGRERISMGIRQHLERGNIPMIPGTVNIHYVVNTLKHDKTTMYRSAQDEVGMFLRAEVHNALVTDQISKEWLGAQLADTHTQEEIAQLLDMGQSDWQDISSNDQVVVPWYLVNHPHADHVASATFVNQNARFAANPEVLAIMAAMNAMASSYDQRILEVTHSTEPMEHNSYPSEDRVTKTLYSPDESIIDGPLRLRTSPIDHSIPSSAQIVEIQNGPMLFKTGDAKLGPFTEATVELFAGEPEILVFDGTNLPGDTRKTYLKHTEADVAHSLERIFKARANRMIVVSAPKNQIHRLNSIIEAADAVGRRVCVMPKHAVMNWNMLLAYDEIPPHAPRTFDRLPRLFDDFALFGRNIKNPQTYERALREMAGRYRSDTTAYVTPEMLSEDPDKWVLVVSPFDDLDKVLSGVQTLPYSINGKVKDQRLVYVHSSYGAYQASSHYQINANFGYVQDNLGGEVIANYERRGKKIVPFLRGDQLILHVSGHASFDELFEGIVAPLLDGKYKNKVLIPSHTEKPRVIANEIRNRLGLDHPDDLHIVDYRTHYDPRRPFVYDPNDPSGVRMFQFPLV